MPMAQPTPGALAVGPPADVATAVPTTREGCSQVTRLACTPAGSCASMAALSVAKSLSLMLSLPAGTGTRMMLAAGMPRACW